MGGSREAANARLGDVANGLLSHIVRLGGSCEATQRGLTSTLGCSVSSVGQVVRRLRDEGAIETKLCYDEFGGVRGSRYEVTDLGRRLLAADEERRQTGLVGGRPVRVMEDQMELVSCLARELHATKQDTVRLLLGEALSARGL